MANSRCMAFCICLCVTLTVVADENMLSVPASNLDRSTIGKALTECADGEEARVILGCLYEWPDKGQVTKYEIDQKVAAQELEIFSHWTSCIIKSRWSVTGRKANVILVPEYQNGDDVILCHYFADGMDIQIVDGRRMLIAISNIHQICPNETQAGNIAQHIFKLFFEYNYATGDRLPDPQAIEVECSNDSVSFGRISWDRKGHGSWLVDGSVVWCITKNTVLFSVEKNIIPAPSRIGPSEKTARMDIDSIDVDDSRAYIRFSSEGRISWSDEWTKRNGNRRRGVFPRDQK